MRMRNSVDKCELYVFLLARAQERCSGHDICRVALGYASSHWASLLGALLCLPHLNRAILWNGRGV